MAFEIIGSDGNTVAIREYSPDVPKGNLGGAGRIIQIPKDQLPAYIKANANEKLKGMPTKDTFCSKTADAIENLQDDVKIEQEKMPDWFKKSKAYTDGLLKIQDTIMNPNIGGVKLVNDPTSYILANGDEFVQNSVDDFRKMDKLIEEKNSKKAN